MANGYHSPDSSGRLPERRKERRYEVQLYGELRYDGAAFAVQIADISGAGALVLMQGPPETGSEAELWIDDFGALPIEIVHAGKHFCGVAIVNSAKYRGRLLDWLQQEAAVGETVAVR